MKKSSNSTVHESEHGLLIHVLRDHCLLGAAAAFCARPFLGTRGAVIFWLATILIDLDHHLDFVLRSGFKDLFRVRKMFQYHRFLFEAARGKEFLAVSVFHSLECLAILAWLSRILKSASLGAVFWGFLWHYLTDLVHLIIKGRTFARAYSLCEYVIRYQRLKMAGIPPGRIQQQVLAGLSAK